MPRVLHTRKVSRFLDGRHAPQELGVPPANVFLMRRNTQPPVKHNGVHPSILDSPMNGPFRFGNAVLALNHRFLCEGLQPNTLPCLRRGGLRREYLQFESGRALTGQRANLYARGS